MENSPCHECERDNDCTGFCLKYKEWFANQWKSLQNVFQVTPQKKAQKFVLKGEEYFSDPYANEFCQQCKISIVDERCEDDVLRCRLHTRGTKFAECKHIIACKEFLPKVN